MDWYLWIRDSNPTTLLLILVLLMKIFGVNIRCHDVEHSINAFVVYRLCDDGADCSRAAMLDVRLPWKPEDSSRPMVGPTWTNVVCKNGEIADDDRICEQMFSEPTTSKFWLIGIKREGAECALTRQQSGKVYPPYITNVTFIKTLVETSGFDSSKSQVTRISTTLISSSLISPSFLRANRI